MRQKSQIQPMTSEVSENVRKDTFVILKIRFSTVDFYGWEGGCVFFHNEMYTTLLVGPTLW